MEENRYLIFAGGFYYPHGGWDDYIGYKTKYNVAVELAQKMIDSEDYDWVQIVDNKTLKTMITISKD